MSSSIFIQQSYAQKSSGEDSKLESGSLIETPLGAEKKQNIKKGQDLEVFLPRPLELSVEPETQGFDSSESVKKFLSSFAIFIVLLVLIFFVFRWLQKKKKGMGRSWGSKVVEVLQQSSISPAHSIQLVQIADKIYILGTSQSNVSLIRVVEEPDELRELRELCKEGKGTLQDYRGFGEVLQSYLPRGWKKSSMPSWGVQSMDLLRKQNK